MARSQRMTIYDILDVKGYFSTNPANVGSLSDDGSSLYKGPVQYPKMLYHPKGETRVVEPAHVEPTPTGNITIPAKTEMIWQIVNNEEEEKALCSDGWHDHPAKAITAAGGKAPPISSDQRIRELEAELARYKTLSSGKRQSHGTGTE